MFAIAAALTAASLFAQPTATHSAKEAVALRAAMEKETVEGDLKGAIEQFTKLAQSKDRAIAAQALVHLAQCHEKLGNQEARKFYERVVQDFAEQNDAVALARARLGDTAPLTTGIVTRQVLSGPQIAVNASISPDGRFLCFADQKTANLAIHDLTNGKQSQLTNTGSWVNVEFAGDSVFSPDGARVAFSWFKKDGRSDLRTVDRAPAGGAPHRVLCANEDIFEITPKDWSPDGKWIAARLERKDHTVQVALVDASDGTLRVLKSVEWSYSTNMRFSPNGQYLAFDLPSSGNSRSRDVFVLAVDGSREIPAVTHAADDAVVGWTPDGTHLVFTSDRTGFVGIYALRFESGMPVGTPEQIKSDIGQAVTIGLTRTGVLYLGVSPGSRDLLTISVDLTSGKVLTSPAPAVDRFLGTNYGPDWSPDGRYLSYLSNRLREAYVLEIRSLETGQTRELRPQLRFINYPRWSPDGQSFIAQGTDLKGRQGIYRINAQTAETQAVAFSESGKWLYIPQWAPDGKRIFYRRVDPDRRNDSLIEHMLASGAERELLRGTLLRWFSVAPDGLRLVCSTRDPDTMQETVSILTVANGERRDLLTSTDFGFPHWTSDGSHILLGKRPEGEIWVLAASGGQPRKLDLDLGRVSDFQVHPNCRQLVFLTRNNTPREVWALENFLPTLAANR